jgi:hypothetical protein
MHLSSTLSWLVDLAAGTSGADRLLADLGAHLWRMDCRSSAALSRSMFRTR